DPEMPAVREYEPSREVAEERYGIPRVTTKRPNTSESLDADERAFDDLREVLDGRQRFRLDGASSKMLRTILGGASDTETVITPDRCSVHFGRQKQRLPSSYRRLAPRVVSELLERAAIQAVRDPMVIGLPHEAVPMVSDFPSWSYEARLV